MKQTITKYQVVMGTLEDQLYNQPTQSLQGRCFCDLWETAVLIGQL